MKSSPVSETLEIKYYIELYKDDLEAILKILKENFDVISASGSGYELEFPKDVDEYINLSPEQISSLKIEARKSKESKPHSFDYIDIEFSKYTQRIRISENQYVYKGIMDHISSIFKSRIRKKVTLLKENYIFQGFSILLIIMSFFLLFTYLNEKIINNKHLYLKYLIFLPFAFYGATIYHKIIGLIPNANYKVIFYKQKASEKKGFFEEHKDQILVQASGRILGGIVLILISGFIGWLLGKYHQ